MGSVINFVKFFLFSVLLQLLVTTCSAFKCHFNCVPTTPTRHEQFSTLTLQNRYTKLNHQSHVVHSHSSNAAVSSPKKTSMIDTLKERLATAGQAGLVAYGLLNCLYYLTLTALAWNLTGRGATPGGASNLSFKEKYLQVIARLGKVSLTVWAGSQATKAIRILSAISMAPLLDKVIDFTQVKLKLQKRSTAVSILIVLLLSTTFVFYASLVFGSIILLR